MSISSSLLFDDAFSQTSSARTAGSPLPDGFLFSGNRRQAATEKAEAKDKPAEPEAVQKYLAQLRSILKS